MTRPMRTYGLGSAATLIAIGLASVWAGVTVAQNRSAQQDRVVRRCRGRWQDDRAQKRLSHYRVPRNQGRWANRAGGLGWAGKRRGFSGPRREGQGGDDLFHRYAGRTRSLRGL